MSKETEYEELLLAQAEKATIYLDADPDDDRFHDFAREEYEAARKATKDFKRENMAQILKDRKAK